MRAQFLILIAFSNFVACMPLKSNIEIREEALWTWDDAYLINQKANATVPDFSEYPPYDSTKSKPNDYTGRIQQGTDPIEQDPTLTCYHFPRRWVNGKLEPHRYRRCYRKDLDCNIRWRKDVLQFRESCGSVPNKFPNDPLCVRSWEPDIEAAEYCRGQHEKEDIFGARWWPCKPQGIGDGAICPGPSSTTECPGEPYCKEIIPFLDSPRCHWIWFECALAYTKMCQKSQPPC